MSNIIEFPKQKGQSEMAFALAKDPVNTPNPYTIIIAPSGISKGESMTVLNLTHETIDEVIQQLLDLQLKYKVKLQEYEDSK